VDDAVQESLLVISRKVGSLKAAAAFSSWLFTVIKRECRKLERMMFKHDPLPDELAEEQMLCRSDHALRIDLAKHLSHCPRIISRSSCCVISKSSLLQKLQRDSANNRAQSKAACIEPGSWCASTCFARIHETSSSGEYFWFSNGQLERFASRQLKLVGAPCDVQTDNLHAGICQWIASADRDAIKTQVMQPFAQHQQRCSKAACAW